MEFRSSKVLFWLLSLLVLLFLIYVSVPQKIVDLIKKPVLGKTAAPPVAKKPLSLYHSPHTYLTPEEVKDKIVRLMFQVNHIPYETKESLTSSFKVYASYLQLPSSLKNLEQAKHTTKVLRELLEQLDFHALAEAIVDVCAEDKDYHMAILLTAIAWQESHFRNVYGRSHGEVTPFQLLPATLKSHFSATDLELRLIIWDLRNNHHKSAQLVYKWMQQSQTSKVYLRQVLRGWNKAPSYPNAVLTKYSKISDMLQQ